MTDTLTQAAAVMATTGPSAADKYANYLMNVANDGIGVVTSICIIIISLPQLFKLLKEKETGDINFVSFWFYHIGIFLWIFFAAFATNRPNWLDTMISEVIALFVNSFVMFALYWFKRGGIPLNQKLHFRTHPFKKQLWYVIGALTALMLVSFAFMAIFFVYYAKSGNAQNGATWGNTASLVISLIIPAGVALPFTPQLVKSFRTNQWQGVSYWLFVLYTINNIAWITFFGLWIKVNDIEGWSNGGNIGGLVWQIIAFILFDIQLVFTVADSIKRRLHPQLYLNQPQPNPENIPEMLVD